MAPLPLNTNESCAVLLQIVHKTRHSFFLAKIVNFGVYKHKLDCLQYDNTNYRYARRFFWDCTGVSYGPYTYGKCVSGLKPAGDGLSGDDGESADIDRVDQCNCNAIHDSGCSIQLSKDISV